MIKNLPVPIINDKKPTVSADGSLMFYNISYAEAYRAKSVGAFTESFHKFIKASGILQKSLNKDVRILDLCFGLGYNCAVTYHYASRQASPHRVHIVSIEKDAELPLIVDRTRILWPHDGYEILRKCMKNGREGRFSMEMYIWEALESIYRINGHFDAVYFDPFSISKNPEMWSADVFRRMHSLLESDGVLVTYACGKKARQNMLDAGLQVEEVSTARGAFHPGTRARKFPL